ncbi:MAG: prepilin peptidase [Candidatus Aenigmatarchaeota archaeon]
MFELIALITALIGGFAAGIWDLRTSDIPDEAPALMVALGLFIWYAFGLTAGEWTPFFTSVVLGTAVFALGWGLYRLGQWGGGDAALLAAMVYLLPDLGFLADYMFNFFVVALAYSVVYATAVGLAHPKIFGYALDEIKRKKVWAVMLGWAIFGAVALLMLARIDADIGLIWWLWLAVFGLIAFYSYAKAIERKLFRRSVPIDKLKVGDVLASSRRWEGVTAEQIAALKRRHVRVAEIKEGVRFGLVFPIALVVTVLFGNLMFWLV